MGLWGVRPMVAELLAACGPQLTCIETVYMPPRGQIIFFRKLLPQATFFESKGIIEKIFVTTFEMRGLRVVWQ